MGKYDCLKIENQLCFPLYACAREVVGKYRPYLDGLGLTYTQYVAMLVIWEYGRVNMKLLGEKLMLDSGTLTPVLKTLESKGYVSRTRSKDDERNLEISATEKGLRLRDAALELPPKLACGINLSPAEAEMLYSLLYKLLEK